MKVILVIFFFILTSFSNQKEAVNYSPRKLSVNLKKVTASENTSLVEIINKGIHLPQGKFFHVISDGKEHGYVYIGRVNSCRTGGCSLVNTSADSFEYFDYYIIFDSQINVILVDVYNYQATHGQEITVKGWLKQFIGYNTTKNIAVGKNIDAISGATISVNGIVDDIIFKTSLLQEITSTRGS